MIFLILFITATLALFGFTTYVSNTIGLENLPSLSDSYYQLKEKAEWKKYLFQAALLISAFTLLPLMLEITPDNFKFLAFLTTAPIIFVGAAPRFKIGPSGLPEYEMERKVHMTAAKLSAFFSFIWVIAIAASSDWRIALTIPIAAIINLTQYKITGHNTKIWFAEMTCFQWTYATVLIRMLQAPL